MYVQTLNSESKSELKDIVQWQPRTSVKSRSRNLLFIFPNSVRRTSAAVFLPLYLVPELPLGLAHLPQLLGQPLVLLRQVSDQLQQRFQNIKEYERDGVTRFSTRGIFHESVSPKPLSIPLEPIRILSKICGDIHSSRCSTVGKWKKNLQPEKF